MLTFQFKNIYLLVLVPLEVTFHIIHGHPFKNLSKINSNIKIGHFTGVPYLPRFQPKILPC